VFVPQQQQQQQQVQPQQLSQQVPQQQQQQQQAAAAARAVCSWFRSGHASAVWSSFINPNATTTSAVASAGATKISCKINARVFVFFIYI
jgi:hypothetical protein